MTMVFDHPLGVEQMRHLGHRHQAVGRLPAGHGHGRIVEDLVGHCGAGGDRLPHRERAAMSESAVADILKEVVDIG